MYTISKLHLLELLLNMRLVRVGMPRYMLFLFAECLGVSRLASVLDLIEVGQSSRGARRVPRTQLLPTVPSKTSERTESFVYLGSPEEQKRFNWLLSWRAHRLVIFPPPRWIHSSRVKINWQLTFPPYLARECVLYSSSYLTLRM